MSKSVERVYSAKTKYFSKKDFERFTLPSGQSHNTTKCTKPKEVNVEDADAFGKILWEGHSPKAA